MQGLSLVAESTGFSLWCLPLLWSTGSVVVAHGLCCSEACGIFLEQGLNLCPLNWQWILYLSTTPSFPLSSVGKESACNAGDLGSVPGLGRSPGEGNGNPLQHSCLENPMDRGAWWATVMGLQRGRHDVVPKPAPLDGRAACVTGTAL